MKKINAEEWIWIFKGPRPIPGFPSGVFSDKESAITWIYKYKLTGCLTKYPIGESVYDWAIRNNYFHCSKSQHTTSEFIENFSSASLEHYHFENGHLD